jgi:mannose-6-phosphate isomerase-like protein (cupin superfamily)
MGSRADGRSGSALTADAARKPRAGFLDVAGCEAMSATESAIEQTLPRRIEKPWGHEIWWAATDQYVGKILHVNKGHRLSLQYHERKDETSYVLSGRLILVQGQSEDGLTERTVSVGDVWRNRPGTIHTIEALEDSDVLEASTPHLDDVVRLRDDYGREGTTAI